MKSKVIKSIEQFEMLKEMLAQDAHSNGVEAIFEDVLPENLPCIVKWTEIQNMEMGMNIDLEGEEFDSQEEMDAAIEEAIEEEMAGMQLGGKREKKTEMEKK